MGGDVLQGLVEGVREWGRTVRRAAPFGAEVRKVEGDPASAGSWGAGDWSGRWGTKLLLSAPILILLWTYVSIGLQREGSLYISNDAGLIKLVNALVDDIDTGMKKYIINNDAGKRKFSSYLSVQKTVNSCRPNFSI